MENNPKLERAKKQVEEEKGFYGHLFTYLVFAVLFFIFNKLTSSVNWWYWPVLGWGIGVFAHFTGTFGKPMVLGSKWEERRIKKLMDQDTSRDDNQ